MFIVCKDRRNVVNVDNVINIEVDGKRVVAVTKVEDMILGLYLEDRAKEVYAEMLETLFPPFAWIFKKCEIKASDVPAIKDGGVISVYGDDAGVECFDCGVYYMPEE